MLFSNIDFSVIYVDPSIAAAGNGSTPNQALKDLPAAASLADRTCYLIRRTDETTACSLPQGTNSAIRHILLMGMPIATDTAYALVPDEAKTSWGGDTAERANIASADASATMSLPNLRTFLLHRLYLQRNGSSASQYFMQSYQTAEYQGMFAVEHCKLGVRGTDIDRDGWTGPAYTNTAMNRYLYFGYVRCLRIQDCTVNYKPHSSDYPAVYCHYPEILDLEDTRVNLLAFENSRSAYALNLKGCYDQQTGTEATVTGVSFRYVFNGTGCRYFPGGLCLGAHLSTRVSGITAASVIPEGMAIPSDSCQPYQSLLSISGLNDFSIRGIDVNLPHFWRHYNHLLYVNGSVQSLSPGVEREISNVSVILGTDETAGIAGSMSYDEYKGSYNSENIHYALCVAMDGGNSSCYPKVCRADGVSVTFARGRAASFSLCRITDSSFQGMVVLSRCMADIDSVSTWFPGYVMRIQSYTHARIGRLTVNRGNETYPYAYDTAVDRDKYSCSCFIGESNVIPEQTALSGSGVSQQFAISCASECGEGHYTLRTQNIAVDTWNVRRTGGAPAALKLWNDKWNNTGMAVLGRKPFKGKLLTAASPGRYILKLHVAWKNYADEDDMGRRFFVTATTGEGSQARMFCSSLGGRWSDDSSSVWENDTDLVRKCLELPVDMETAGTVDVRLFFSWYSADGFLYVDPAMTLELQETPAVQPPEE